MNIQIKLVLLFVIFSPISSFCQNEIAEKIDSLKYVEDMPYICDGFTGCGDDFYWSAVKLKEKGILLLIEKLNDSTSTKAGVPLFGGNHSVADIAYVALEEIIHGIPTFELLEIDFDQEGCGYCAYWNFLRSDYKNRLNFQVAVKSWYDKNKKDLVWILSDEFSSCDCNGKHPNEGHYELKKE